MNAGVLVWLSRMKLIRGWQDGYTEGYLSAVMVTGVG